MKARKTHATMMCRVDQNQQAHQTGINLQLTPVIPLHLCYCLCSLNCSKTTSTN